MTETPRFRWLDYAPAPEGVADGSTNERDVTRVHGLEFSKNDRKSDIAGAERIKERRKQITERRGKMPGTFAQLYEAYLLLHFNSFEQT